MRGVGKAAAKKLAALKIKEVEFVFADELGGAMPGHFFNCFHQFNYTPNPMLDGENGLESIKENGSPKPVASYTVRGGLNVKDSFSEEREFQYQTAFALNTARYLANLKGSTAVPSLMYREAKNIG